MRSGGHVIAYVRRQLAAVLRHDGGSRQAEHYRALGALAERASYPLIASDDLTRFECKVTSQNGEDGIIVEILNRIGVAGRFFVEFGIQTGHQGNCLFLADVLGWSGLFIEASTPDFERLSAKYRNTNVRTAQELITPDNVETVFAACDVPDEPDILSIDIDGNDIWVWNAINAFRPRLVIIEYNSALDPDVDRCQVFDPDEGWNVSAGFGSSLAALDVVAATKGYRLVHTDLAGVNAFYVREDLNAAVGVERPPRRNVNYGLADGRLPAGEPRLGWTSFASPPNDHRPSPP